MGSREQYRALTRQIAQQQFGNTPTAEVFYRMMSQESGDFDPRVVEGQIDSSAGARGIAQLMPVHWKAVDPLNPAAALAYGANYLKQNMARYGGDLAKGVAAYNAGPGNIDKAVQAGGANWQNFIPAETKKYLQITQPGVGGSAGATNPTAARAVNVSAPLGSTSTSTGGSLVFPVQGYKGKVDLHWGQDRGGSDIFAAPGTPVVAMTDGQVIAAGYNDIGGWNVTIQGSDGLTYYMAHLIDQPKVQAGQQVTAGTLLGGVGDTGNAKGTGAHLHIGIGPEIVRGTGPTGGSGKNFDAVSHLTRALEGGNMPDPNTSTTTAGSPVGISRQTGGAEPGLAGTPATTRIPNMGPAPTNASAAAALVRERANALLQSMQTQTDAGQLQVLLGTYTAMTAQADALENPNQGRSAYSVGGQTYDIDSETAARLAQDYGITQQQIEARRSEQEAEFVRDYALAQLQISASAVQQGANREVEYAKLNQDMQQFMARYGLDERRIGVDMQRLGLDQEIAQASQQIAQGQLQLGQQRLGLDTELGRGNLDIDRQRLGIEQQNADRTFGLEQQRLGLDVRRTDSQERQQTIAALVDLVGMQVQAGQLSARQAEKALDALVDLYKFDPTESPYAAGMEPGGIGQVMIEKMGGTYDPGAYRKRTFPIDLATMAKAGSQFDMSKAWQQAQSMMAGMFPNVQGGTPMPGGGMAPSAAVSSPGAPAGPSIGTAGTAPATASALSAGGSPTMPGQAPGLPAASPLPGQTPGAPPQTPGSAAPAAAAPPQAPAAPPDCGPGYAPAWDGNQWVCKAKGTGGVGSGLPTNSPTSAQPPLAGIVA